MHKTAKRRKSLGEALVLGFKIKYVQIRKTNLRKGWTQYYVAERNPPYISMKAALAGKQGIFSYFCSNLL